MSELTIFPDVQQLYDAAADAVVKRAREAIEARGRFHLVLAGGSTPRALYEKLASQQYAPLIDWPNVHLYWGDERCVPPDHADSNYGMANEALLKHVPVPMEHIHRMKGELRPEEAEADYRRQLAGIFGGQVPQFDLVLLGMGDDAHTASLFPGEDAIHEQEKWVMAYHVDHEKGWRITLTPPVFDQARDVLFLVSGVGKATALRHVLHEAHNPTAYPAQVIQPVSGRLLWYVDRDAASRLPAQG